METGAKAICFVVGFERLCYFQHSVSAYSIQKGEISAA